MREFLSVIFVTCLRDLGHVSGTGIWLP